MNDTGTPLSDGEQHALKQIEEDLRAQAPRLASALESAERGAAGIRQAPLLILAGLFIGFVLLVLGLRLDNAFGTSIGVLGGTAVIAAANLAVNVVAHRWARRRERKGRLQ